MKTIDPHRKAHIERELTAWAAAKPSVPVDTADWSIDDAKAVAGHIRAFDVMMHSVGLCPPRGGVSKAATQRGCTICCAIVDARRAAKKKAGTGVEEAA